MKFIKNHNNILNEIQISIGGGKISIELDWIVIYCEL